MSNLLYDKKIIQNPTSDNNSKSNKNLLKFFLRNFHQKVTNTNDFSIFENTLIEWMNNIIDENTLKLMQDHNESEFWFSSVIGFFYQYGVNCEIDKDKALKLYLLTINN